MEIWKKFCAAARLVKLVEPYTLKVEPINLNGVSVELMVYKDNVWVGSVNVRPEAPDTVWIDSGYTPFKYRRQGVGTWLRALVVDIAKDLKIREVLQFSKNTNHLSSNRPPSAYIMNKLGFNKLPFRDPMHPKTEFRSINTSRANVKRFLKNVVR